MKAGDEYYEQRYRVRHEEDGSWVYVHDQGIIVSDDDGVPKRIVGSRRDISKQIEMDHRLRDAEERRRLALEATQTGTWEWSAGSDEMVWDRRQCEIFGMQFVERVPLADVRSRLHPEDAKLRDDRLSRAMKEGTPYECEVRLVFETGETRWISEKGDILGTGRNKRLIGISFDVTEAKEAQARDALLMAELDHRVKNILASIQAVARQSVKGKANGQEFVAALEGRLQALSNMHSLLSSMKWSGVKFHELLDALFAPYASPGNDRLTVVGPAFTLTPNAAQPVALTIHELATNAVKHGALSKQDGKVKIEWEETARESESIVVLHWTERKGPRVSRPKSKGFGLKVIENLVASELGATVEMDFRPTGLICRIAFPRARILAHMQPETEAPAAEPDEVSYANAATGEPAECRSLRLMVVEDTWVVALQLKTLLEDLGHEVVGPAGTVEEAIALSEVDGIDAALLDIQLGDETVFPVAERLADRGVPFAFVTGFTDASVIPKPFRDSPNLAKPFNDEALASVLNRLTRT